jgi:uncharacterized protein (TIGR03083 family)
MSNLLAIQKVDAMEDFIEALGADRAELIRICEGLDAAEWAAPSGCPGWSVKDLVAHMGALFWSAVDLTVLPDISGLATEAAQEVLVKSRRSLTAEEVLNDYAAVSEKALTALAGFAGADFEVPLGDLGTYQARILPAAFCFDHYTHIRADLFAPRGPLPGPTPPSDELRLAPALTWIETALPQQNAGLLDRVTGAADILITGTAGRTIRVGDPAEPASALVRSGGDACVRWITQRASWEDLGVYTEGNPRVLSALRELKVF